MRRFTASPYEYYTNGEKALELLKKVGLSDKADQYPGKLSGGSRKILQQSRESENPRLREFLSKVL